MIWTEEAIARLRELWASGVSCTAIARELGTGSKNSVIGKVHRLGLPPRQSPLPTSARRTVPVPGAVPVTLHHATLATLALTSRTCRWPIGDPASPDFRYCGALPRRDGAPYCDLHWKIAYRPTPARRVAGQKVAA